MSWSRRVVDGTLVPLIFCLSVGFSLGQVYDLKNDVLDDGGTKLTSSGYVVRGSFGQPTIGKISSSGYTAIIGFWHSPYAPPTGVEEELLVPRPVPAVFSLSQNYPNPLGELTIINYQLPKPVRITLRIYDLSGRVVRTLVDEKQEPGYYSVTWDLRGATGERLPDGVYLYRLKACPEHGRGTGQFIRTRKMVVVR